ncbi:Oidioi.mRNA.OKI2018_I69.XSR.g15093.t1.cds [Oikopleura dioica]|uniref:Oidioi.mRNA.OKI2018_I69.XSR.g15093.t1.cds n=1 Tax=Oikopleura dioica TaxID=34765 RepID=A0ABN7SBS2_OIKDI|nr:Oidioi.mRNA.OKI2018_I69.XSR.g15093.t1.cds [Oikopleura dioica]
MCAMRVNPNVIRHAESQVEYFKDRVLPIRKLNRSYDRRNRSFGDLIDKLSSASRRKFDFEQTRLQENIKTIKYSRKHNSIFKKLHTPDALKIANRDAYQELEKVDPKGTLWKAESFENIYGYKRPIGRSPEAYQLLSKIEKESSPDQILAKRIQEEKERQEQVTRETLNRDASFLRREVADFSRMNMSCKSAKRRKLRAVKRNEQMPTFFNDFPRSETQREIKVTFKRRDNLR